ncbi:hypothetical protein HKCCSP123_03125 [Rhodobacterales bacterium HKCCSP123]|nr:hypothetical protein [Rhodobacterales bacterium HKCCSP123]
MPKIELTCQNCGKGFSVFPAFLRHAEKRGTRVRFCSRACTDEARSKGIIGTKKRRGIEVECVVCGKKVYRPLSRVKEGRTYVCSEACRLKAHEEKLIDRTAPRPNRLLGEEINCCICGKTVYRKKSMIERNIAKTCGNPDCVSAYSRSLWGLPPHPPDKKRYKKGPARRATNFTAKQRMLWTGSECVRCGATENLSLDHIIPVSAGGRSVKSNAQTLCQPCNIWKANHEDRQMALEYNKHLRDHEDKPEDP